MWMVLVEDQGLLAVVSRLDTVQLLYSLTLILVVPVLEVEDIGCRSAPGGNMSFDVTIQNEKKPNIPSQATNSFCGGRAHWSILD
jgi:hypothetical protein